MRDENVINVINEGQLRIISLTGARARKPIPEETRSQAATTLLLDDIRTMLLWKRLLGPLQGVYCNGVDAYFPM